MKDLLRGFLGTLLYWFLAIVGIGLIIASFVANNIWLFILAIVCFSLMAGIKYWLGHIVRIR